MKSISSTNRCRQLVALIILSITTVGCGRYSSSSPVDEFAAREACEEFLEAWKEGKNPDDLKPTINGADYVWSSGQTLVSFEVLPEEINKGNSLLVSAQLTTKNAKGVQTKSKATYTVGTSPVVTVIRDDF